MAVSLGLTEARKMATALEPEYSEWVARVKALEKELRAAAKAAGKAFKDADPSDYLDPLSAKELNDLSERVAGVEEFAAVALDAAEEIIQGKAKFTIVSQVKPEGDKVALGWYSTEGKAKSDALSMSYSTSTHEEAWSWVLPIHHGSPAGWYKERKADASPALVDMEYRQGELLRRERWLKDNPDTPIPEDWSIEVVTKIDTNECEACFGMGRIPSDDVRRRSELPDSIRNAPRIPEGANYA